MDEVEVKETPEFAEAFEAVERELGKVIVGQTAVVRQVLTAVFAGGNVLLEGVPGLGKTLLVRTLAASLDLSFGRVQFTPDLMPADIVGTTVIVQDDAGRREFTFRKGPVFTQVLLADEVNRATPRTQSALLEAMQEGSVTVSGRTHILAQPFVVLATQNPLEMEGTYPLPEAQLDRFMLKIDVPFPTEDELVTVLDRTTGLEESEPERVLSGPQLLELRRQVRAVPIGEAVKRYVVRLVRATRPEVDGSPEPTRRFVQYGASPRGAQAIVLASKVRALLEGHSQVDYDDVRAVARPSLRHRVVLNFEAGAAGVDVDGYLGQILELVPDVDPRLKKEVGR